MSKKASTALVPTGDRGAIQLVMDLEAEGKLTSISLDLVDPEMPFDQWTALGRFFGTIDRASRWWIGDWLNFGEAVYGEESAQGVDDPVSRYDEAERVTGLDHGTLMNIRSICGKVAKARRRPELGFWIHAEVAPLEPDEQKVWLQRAIDHAWNRQDLRQAIKDEKAPPADDPVDDGGGEGLTIAERIEQAARLVFHQAQRSSDGSAVVPAEAWAQLVAALGEER